MDKISEKEVAASKVNRLSVLRITDEFKSFTEKPSDKYDPINTDATGNKKNSPINGFELFSLFTADIIKQNVLFSR